MMIYVLMSCKSNRCLEKKKDFSSTSRPQATFQFSPNDAELSQATRYNSPFVSKGQNDVWYSYVSNGEMVLSDTIYRFCVTQ